MHRLLDKIARTVARYLQAQIDAGAEAVQLFDTWGGLLPHDAFAAFSLDYCRRIIGELDGSVPRILFIKGAGLHLDDVVGAGSEAIGVDYTVDPQYARDVVGGRVAIQGNLPPHALLGPEASLREKVRSLLAILGSLDGYVFNLGHGILPPTPLDHVRAVIEEVRRYRRDE